MSVRMSVKVCKDVCKDVSMGMSVKDVSMGICCFAELRFSETLNSRDTEQTYSRHRVHEAA